MNDVLIIEDHPFAAEAIKELLAKVHPDLAFTVCNAAKTAMQELQRLRPWQLILLDLDVPGAHGLSLALEIQRKGLAHVTCVVSALERIDFISQIKARGFLGYIVKATPAPKYFAQLVQVCSGERVFPGAEVLPVPSAVTRVTQRQTEVLELVSRGFSSKQIATQLFLSEGTVNNHVATILELLDADSRSHAVAKAIELGFIRLAGRSQRAG